MDQNQEQMSGTPRWGAKDLSRLIHISAAVALIVTTWAVVALPHSGSPRPAAPSQGTASRVLPAPDPGSAPLYWIRLINTPDNDTAPAWALWITPINQPLRDQVQFARR